MVLFAAGAAFAASLPAPVRDDFEYAPGQAVLLDVLANDRHPSGVSLRIHSGEWGPEVTLDEDLQILRFDPPVGLTSAYVFSYRVIDSAGAISEPVTVTVTKGSPTFYVSSPSTVFGLGATAVGPSGIDLAWSLQEPGILGFLVERETSPGAGVFDLLATVAPTTLSYSDQGLAPATLYCYRAVAQYSGFVRESSVACATTDPAAGPSFAQDDALLDEAGKRLVIEAARDLLANDQGSGLTLVGWTAPSAGQILEVTSEVLVFEPPSSVSGPYTFGYTVRRADGAEAQATVTVSVAAAGGPPTAVDDAFVLGAGGQLCFTREGLVENDVGTELTVVQPIGEPYRGSLGVASGGWQYHPNGSGAGWDVVAYGVRDSAAAQDEATVLIERAGSGGGNPPVAVTDRYRLVTNEHEHWTLGAFLGNDFDPDCGEVEFVSVDSTSAAGQAVTLIGDFILYTAPSQVGIDSFSYRITDGTSTAEGTVEIEVVPAAPPVADLDPLGCDVATLTCSFDGSRSELGSGLQAFAWTLTFDFGDGHVQTNAVTVSHTYAVPGYYPVSLTVHDFATGFEDTDVAFVAVGVQGFLAGFDWACDYDRNCTFDAGPSVIPAGQTPTYNWQFISFFSSCPEVATAIGGPVIQRQMACPGPYRVTLVIDLPNGDSAQYRRIVEMPVNQPPQAAFEPLCVELGPPFRCLFDASASVDDQGIASYLWDFGDGTVRTGNRVDLHDYAQPGTHEVTLTVADASGLSATATRLAEVPTEDYPPTAHLLADCEEQPGGPHSCTFLGIGSQDDSRQVPESYRWTLIDRGSGAVVLDQVTAVSYLQVADLPSAEYEARLVVSDSRLQASDPASRILYLGVPGNELPQAFFVFECSDLGGPWDCSFGAARSVDNDTSFPDLSYTWRVDGVEVTNSTLPWASYVAPSAGVIEVELEIEDLSNVGAPAGSATDRYTRRIFVGDPYDSPPVASALSSCIGASCTFDARGSRDDLGIAGFEWRFPDLPPSPGPIYSPPPLQPGVLYTVPVTIWDTTGHAAVAYAVVQVGLPPTAVDDYAVATYLDKVKVYVLENDGDPDGDPLTIVGVGQAAHGDVKIRTPEGKPPFIRYRHTDPYSFDPDRFVYYVSDGDYVSEAEVHVQISRPLAPGSD